jgi:hypothetical protein
LQGNSGFSVSVASFSLFEIVIRFGAFHNKFLLAPASGSPAPRCAPPGARPFGGNKDRETYRKELIEELTAKILDLTPRNDREALIQLGCIVDQWKPRLENGEQRPGGEDGGAAPGGRAAYRPASGTFVIKLLAR